MQLVGTYLFFQISTVAKVFKSQTIQYISVLK